ncbi:MAG: methionine--tRNA ligase [Candidatus ainarchaeum sp.]|nr:methionine--tRNA ligase [Candidatus ainarchaeum sp.]
MKTFYITTAIVYPNSDPHIGFAYEQICADTIARWHRLLEEEVFFLTGSDEHGAKIAAAAKKAGKEPKEFVDEQVKKFIEIAKTLNLAHSRFIRTTDKDHEKIAKEIFQKIFNKRDIYKGTYSGLYCVGCESFLTEKDLVEGKCPIHHTEPQILEEENYFFRLGKYEKQVLNLLENGFFEPSERVSEIINRIKQNGLQDLSVSRPKTNVAWGIECPFDKNQTIYVWFDALLNYVSGAKTGKKDFWPADLHIIGKEISWFHCVIWPAMLLSAGLQLPKKVFAHGWLTVNGQKMSKSQGNVINPEYLCKQYSADVLRYLLMREIPFGQDGDFSEASLKTRNNNELANELGNLANRTIVMLEKYCNGKIPKAKTSPSLEKSLNLEKIEAQMENLELHAALSEIFAFISACNKFINDKAPWKLKGRELEEVLYSLTDSIRIISILLSAFMPETSKKINEQFGLKPGLLKECKFNLLKPGTQTKKGEILFKKAE